MLTQYELFTTRNENGETQWFKQWCSAIFVPDVNGRHLIRSVETTFWFKPSVALDVGFDLGIGMG